MIVPAGAGHSGRQQGGDGRLEPLEGAADALVVLGVRAVVAPPAGEPHRVVELAGQQRALKQPGASCVVGLAVRSEEEQVPGQLLEPLARRCLDDDPRGLVSGGPRGFRSPVRYATLRPVAYHTVIIIAERVG